MLVPWIVCWISSLSSTDLPIYFPNKKPPDVSIRWFYFYLILCPKWQSDEIDYSLMTT